VKKVLVGHKDSMLAHEKTVKELRAKRDTLRKELDGITKKIAEFEGAE